MKLASHTACCDVSDGGVHNAWRGQVLFLTPIVGLSTDAGHGHIIMREGESRC